MERWSLERHVKTETHRKMTDVPHVKLRPAGYAQAFLVTARRTYAEMEFLTLARHVM